MLYTGKEEKLANNRGLLFVVPQNSAVLGTSGEIPYMLPCRHKVLPTAHSGLSSVVGAPIVSIDMNDTKIEKYGLIP